MNTFSAVLKNNYKRGWTRVVPFAVITLISLVSILFAAYLSNKPQVLAHVAVIGDASQLVSDTGSAHLKITLLDQKPPLSDLYEQKYDAYLTLGIDSKPEIQTLKSSEYKSLIMALIQNPDAAISANYQAKTPGESIVGFMLMFLLMISFQNMTYFADDKEQGQLTRIFVAPASFFWYVMANMVFSLSMFLPQLVFLVVLDLLHINIGFTILEFTVFLIVISVLGSTFAMLLHTLIHKPDNANMLGSSVTVLTSILGGSFYSFSKNNQVLDAVIRIIPQKQILDFARNITALHSILDLFPILYVLLLSLLFFAVSCIILQKRYVKAV